MRDTTHYALSQDYEQMFVLLENGPLLGFVDYEHGSTLRDPVQIKRVADGKYFEYRAGVRGFGYINAFSKDAKDKFVEQCRKYNLSFIVPNADAEARAEKAEKELAGANAEITELRDELEDSRGTEKDAPNVLCAIARLVGVYEHCQALGDDMGTMSLEAVQELLVEKQKSEDDNMRLRAELKQGGVDYCALMDRHDAQFVRAEQFRAEVDWQSKACAMHCRDKSTEDSQCSISDCGTVHCLHASADQWEEAARRAVADESEGEG